jgi:hypothetical protein
MDKKIELEACPWCGGTDVGQHYSWRGHYLECAKCNFSLAINGTENDSEMIDAWNTLRAMKDNIDRLNRRHEKDHKMVMSLGSKNAVLQHQLSECVDAGKENAILRDALMEIADCITPKGEDKLEWAIKTASDTLAAVNN